MMKQTITFLTAFFLVGFAATVMAVDLDTENSYYKISGYSFSAEDSFSDTGSRISVTSFSPLLITNHQADILHGSREFNEGAINSTSRSFGVTAQYAATPTIELHGAVGITKNNWTSSDYGDSSWEADLGVIYKLFSNLRYEVHFGYMDTGDVYKERGTFNDVESIIMISNKITMSF